jgi:hypothetical protein
MSSELELQRINELMILSVRQIEEPDWINVS